MWFIGVILFIFIIGIPFIANFGAKDEVGTEAPPPYTK